MLFVWPPIQTVSSSAPVSIAIDGLPTTVNIDTVTPVNTIALPSGQWFKDENGAVEVYRDSVTEANSKPMPSGMYFIKDSVVTPVLLDTTTPANTMSLPVTLVDVTGVPATINVTTGDLNVEISHDGVAHSWDSTRIGDGTNLMAVNATNEALVHDTDAIAQLVLVNAKDFATETTLSALAAVDFATEAKQDAEIALLTTINAKDFATETTLSVLAAVDFATEAKQDNIITELQAIKNASIDTVEDYYKRDFVASPLTVASSWVTLRALTAPIRRISVTNNSGNELLIRNQTTNKSLIVGQGAVFNSPLVGAIADVIQISALGADAIDGIIYVNFEG